VIDYKQEPPNCVQIELVEGCNLGCSFCGLQHIRDNGANGPEKKHGRASAFKFMTTETAVELAQQLRHAVTEHKWNPRIEFAMHGEPTMHTDYVGMVKIFREYLPTLSMQMTSNGGGLLRGAGMASNINAVLEAGINVLCLDNYDGIKIVDKILQGYNGPYDVKKYPQNPKANPHTRRKPSVHEVVVIQDIEAATKGNHSIITNHAGASFPPNENAQGKRCAKPFREISVRWDGNIGHCCNDWVGRYKIGHVSQGLEALWQGEGFMAARRALLHGMRTFEPCKGCDYTSYRVGLLPDRLGKKTLPPPDEQTWETIRKHTEGEPYTPRVKRPWDT
jgi:radical SAM protein with 4Fe4S-binding SPASM domain